MGAKSKKKSTQTFHRGPGPKVPRPSLWPEGDYFLEKFLLNARHGLSRYLRKICTLHFQSIERMPFEEVMQNVAASSVFAILAERGPIGSMCLVLDNKISLALIEACQGGRPMVHQEMRGETEEEREDGLNKSYSIAELSILKKIFDIFAREISSSGKDISKLDLGLKCQKLETHPSLVNVFFPSEMILVIEFTLKCGDRQGMVNLLLPQSCLKLLQQKKSLKKSENLQSTVELSTTLDNNYLDLEQLLSLKEGDNLLLDHLFPQGALIHVNGYPFFQGKFIQKDGKGMIQIEKIKNGN